MDVEPVPPPVAGPSERFHGEVQVDLITTGHGAEPVWLGVVSFAPGARTAWHSHSVAQTLRVTAGEGRAQARGGPVHRLVPGDVVHAHSGEWHWHGASAEHSMTHLAFTEGETTWGEHVTDAEYADEPDER
jgi:quercetin dioxygenase-like cupin family protein